MAELHRKKKNLRVLVLQITFSKSNFHSDFCVIDLLKIQFSPSLSNQNEHTDTQILFK